MASYTAFMVDVYKAIPATLAGFFRALLIYVPIMLAILIFVYSLLLSTTEHWTVLDAFICIAAKFAGLSLGRFAYSTERGMFVVGFAYYVQLSLSGVIIGILFSHPLLQTCISLLEGRRAMRTAQSLDKVHKLHPPKGILVLDCSVYD